MLFNSPKSCLIYKHSGTTTMGDVAFSHEDTGDDFFFFNFFLGGQKGEGVRLLYYR